MIALAYDPAQRRIDLRRDGGNLATDDGLESAVMLSLFSDARASAEETETPDRRGWWGDSYPAIAGDELGSKLWLLERGVNLPTTLRRAEAYASAALAWLIEDGIAQTVTATAERVRQEVLGLRVTIVRPGDLAPRWERFWEVHSNAI